MGQISQMMKKIFSTRKKKPLSQWIDTILEQKKHSTRASTYDDYSKTFLDFKQFLIESELDQVLPEEFDEQMAGEYICRVRMRKTTLK